MHAVVEFFATLIVALATMALGHFGVVMKPVAECSAIQLSPKDRAEVVKTSAPLAAPRPAPFAEADRPHIAVTVRLART
ncbi:hypothetical protein C5708_03285 [Caulobacter sp. CCUG 60055]|uniref:hypothetical protein n=1 Tax=Caulobacter sp. CCUG 60055 TaxID=2100090 RepID=UPI001FA6DE06|nr:hypothetical protein [Caulobacter sp. CCUG 60055]MBQ1540863.1 hypothetical protein [Caulobacteraceae bacterium]MCI3179268.1 hypothetical protein [Caulobacter sp. CCUG 60055]